MRGAGFAARSLAINGWLAANAKERFKLSRRLRKLDHLPHVDTIDYH